jgi:SAM-dependent methyltransferase
MSIPDPPLIKLDDLPKYSPWPARLLGREAWVRTPRDRADVLREYDRDKWGRLLRKAEESASALTIEAVESWEIPDDTPTVSSVENEFLLLKPSEARNRAIEVVARALGPYLEGASALVDLGCGYGNILLRLGLRPEFGSHRLWGGDVTTNGVALAAKLAAATRILASFGKCDLESTPMTEFEVPAKALIYTSFAVPCVPFLKATFVDAMLAMHPAVVVHIEPCYEHFDDASLLGLLRRRYIEVNGYNQNLLSVLREHEGRGRLRIVAERPSVFGQNPLLPASVIAWVPTG